MFKNCCSAWSRLLHYCHVIATANQIDRKMPQPCSQNTLDAILEWWKYEILVGQKERQNLNSLLCIFCKQRLMTVSSSHLDLIVPWPSFQDNTEESVAMSSKSNAFKASRREDNDNHAAVANIKGTSSVFILRFLPLNSDFQKTRFFGIGIYESKYRKFLKETLPRIRPTF